MKIKPPTNCPSCDSLLVNRNEILYCENNDCVATSQKRVEHFAKTMKIKGLGPAAIEKLDINDITEIYEIDIAYITLCLNSAKMAVKLFDEIENSKQHSLDTLLPAFGIPLIGKTAADKLSRVCDYIFNISANKCKEAGLGPKATENLMNWLDNVFDNKYSTLPFSFKFENTREASKGIICISGKLKSYKTKAEASTVLQSLGYKVKDSLTKDVTILINESGTESAKVQKARESGILIVNNLNQLIEG